MRIACILHQAQMPMLIKAIIVLLCKMKNIIIFPVLILFVIRDLTIQLTIYGIPRLPGLMYCVKVYLFKIIMSLLLKLAPIILIGSCNYCTNILLIWAMEY